MITKHGDGGFTVSGPQDMNFFALLTLQSGLKLEARCPGMKMSRISALQCAKRNFGLKGSRAKIMLQVDQLVAAEKAKRADGTPGEDLPQS